MHLFVVLDTKGSGRVLGVFDDRQRAEEITGRYPHYYHLRPAGLMSEVPMNKPARAAGASPDQVHVVVDTMGHYRLVGVLAERGAAERLVKRSPGYYRIAGVNCADVEGPL